MSKEKIRIVYFGTPEFAVPSLEKLVEENYEVAAVVTSPDRQAGRGRKVKKSAVKEAAEKLNIPVLQPTKLKSPEFIEELESLNANLFIIVAFRMLPEVVWAMPKLGSFNLHAALLPKYRGAAPINWAVINGEKETGMTTFFLKHEIDTGNIIFKQTEPIHHSDTTGDVYNRLMKKGAGLIVQTVQQIELGNVKTFPQEESKDLPKAPKIFKEDCEIDWSKNANEIYNFIRGMAPYPSAWTKIEGTTYKIHRSHPVTKVTEEVPQLQAGEYFTDNKTKLLFGTKNGIIAIQNLQKQGKKAMDIEDFLRGNSFNESKK